MILYLLRHGIAEDVSPLGDSERELTEEGRRKLDLTLAAAQRAGVRPDLILSSPFIRAEQTAEMAATRLGSRDEPESEGFLMPFSDVLVTWEEIRGLREFSSVLLVGHNPHLTALLCAVLNCPGTLAMKKGTLARLDVDLGSAAPSGSLDWLLTAKLAGG
ncbi:MAG: phosphohistidine phosphatase SixA [Acidobacteriota bacterium]